MCLRSRISSAVLRAWGTAASGSRRCRLTSLVPLTPLIVALSEEEASGKAAEPPLPPVEKKQENGKQESGTDRLRSYGAGSGTWARHINGRACPAAFGIGQKNKLILKRGGEKPGRSSSKSLATIHSSQSCYTTLPWYTTPYRLFLL